MHSDTRAQSPCCGSFNSSCRSEEHCNLLCDRSVTEAGKVGHDAEQAELIRKSFDAMGLARRRIADLCCQRLFELAPDARSLFPDDVEQQQLKLMDMIAALVGALDQRELFGR